ncbi:MAG: lysylphosphatidylglycerol synthase transmembrane domain-containing protein [Candidatus Diapherotrites archaeon]
MISIKKNKSKILRIVIGAVILLLILKWVGFNNVFTELQKINPLFFVLAFLIVFFIIFLNFICVKIFLDKIKKIDSKHFFYNYCYSWALGFLAPGKIGDFSLAYFLRKEFKPGQIVASMILDKGITIVLLSVFLTFFIFFFSPENLFWNVIFLVLLWGAIIFGFYSVFSLSKNNFLMRFIFKNVTPFFGVFHETLLSLAKNKSILLCNFVITFFRIILQGVLIFVLLLGLGEMAAPFIIILINSSSLIVSYIPISIGGLGIREGAFILFSQQFVVNLTTLAAALGYALILNFVAMVIIGLLYFKKTILSNTKK